MGGGGGGRQRWGEHQRPGWRNWCCCSRCQQCCSCQEGQQRFHAGSQAIIRDHKPLRVSQVFIDRSLVRSRARPHPLRTCSSVVERSTADSFLLLSGGLCMLGSTGGTLGRGLPACRPIRYRTGSHIEPVMPHASLVAPPCAPPSLPATGLQVPQTACTNARPAPVPRRQAATGGRSRERGAYSRCPISRVWRPSASFWGGEERLQARSKRARPANCLLALPPATWQSKTRSMHRQTIVERRARSTVKRLACRRRHCCLLRCVPRCTGRLVCRDGSCSTPLRTP